MTSRSKAARRDLCADEILKAVHALWRRLPVPVEVADVAEHIGASEASVRPRMARMADRGQLVRDGALYTVAS